MKELKLGDNVAIITNGTIIGMTIFDGKVSYQVRTATKNLCWVEEHEISSIQKEVTEDVRNRPKNN